MKTYDIVWKRTEDKYGRARWERVGILLVDEAGKMRIKLDLIPAGNWDGWLVVSERKEREEPF